MKEFEEDDFNEQELFRPVPKASVPSKNPLAGYFRMPGLHVTLPTKGAFLPKGEYEATLVDDVPVYPMKASDELLLRSPDALMSGLALENLLASCVPAIHNPRLISTPDLDALLLAIRAATYGDNMELEVKCPKCGHENAFDCHLPSIMGKMTYLEPSYEVRLTDDIVVSLRPYNLATATKIANGSFNEARALQVASDSEDEEVMKKARNASFSKMSELSMEAMADCVISVAVPTGVVTNPADILEFLNNTNQAWVKKIEKMLEEMNSKGIDKSVDAECAKCQHKWTDQIEFDPTSFFGEGS